ncbi:hypothetical protein DL96DRAFT_117722 [Flagelloscypha sp. PMI_526]|nr:hypothetical protein DL96DRAFT_117722 [Flagelloscypha sp. PMI_526]
MSTPPAPSSPSNKGSISLRSRVGSLMRRASLIPSRPSSPSPSQPGRKSSSASLSRAFSRESLKSGKSAKDRGSPPDATSRKSESINEEQRPEPDRLHVQPVGPTPAGVPSPIVEVDSPLTQTNQDAPFEIPQPVEEPQQEVAKQEEVPEPEPRALEEDAPAPLSDEPESIKQDEEPAQPEVRFEEPTPVEEEGAAKETLTIRDGPEKEGLVIRDSTPYPSQASSPVEAKPSEQTFGAAVLPERIVHDVSNPWNHEVNENFSRPPPG